jgi:hypothetical protein
MKNHEFSGTNVSEPRHFDAILSQESYEKIVATKAPHMVIFARDSAAP